MLHSPQARNSRTTSLPVSDCYVLPSLNKVVIIIIIIIIIIVFIIISGIIIISIIIAVSGGCTVSKQS